MELILIVFIVTCYPLSIFFDTSVYNLKFLLNKNSDVRYWMSTVQVFQYAARIFMVIFIPGISLLTEITGDLFKVHILSIIIHFNTSILLLFCLFSFSKLNRLNLFLISIIKMFTGGGDVNEGFKKKNISLNFSLALFKNKIFIASYFSQLLVGISMTYVYIFSFYFKDRILTLNSMTQIINMVAISVLLVAVDPRIMSSFDSENHGSDGLKIIFISRSLAHMSVALLFLFLMWF